MRLVNKFSIIVTLGLWALLLIAKSISGGVEISKLYGVNKRLWDLCKLLKSRDDLKFHIETYFAIKEICTIAERHEFQNSTQDPTLGYCITMAQRINKLETKCNLEETRKLIYMVEQDYGEYEGANVGIYLERYMMNHLHSCGVQVNQDIMHKLSEEEPIEKLSQLISNLQQTSQEADYVRIRTLIPSRSFAVAVIDHLESLGYEVDKPHDRSLPAHQAKIKDYIHREYQQECRRTFEVIGPHQDLCEYMDKVAPLGISQFFSVETRKITTLAMACKNIQGDLAEHVYAVARYQFDELRRQTMTDRPGPEMERDDLSNLFAEILSVARAEYIFLHRDLSTLIRAFEDLQSLKNRDISKCTPEFVKRMLDLQGRDWNTTIRSYLKLYNQLQVNICSTLIARNIQKSIGGRQWPDIDRLLIEVEAAGAQMNIANRLGRSISNDIIVTALERQLESRGLRMQSMAQPTRLTAVNNFRNTFQLSCRRLKQLLHSTWQMFKPLFRLGVVSESNFGHQTMRWMCKYNLCLSMFGPGS